MLKSALFYANFEGIHRRIELSLGRRTSMIVDATISYENSTKWDVTSVLNTWLTSLRSPDLKNFIILGEGGKLNILQDLINQWQKNANPLKKREAKSKIRPKY